jgi:hypothetical protein
MCYALSSQCTAHITGITGLKRISKKRRQNAPNKKKKKSKTTETEVKPLSSEGNPSTEKIPPVPTSPDPIPHRHRRA